jgi:hypothetical protein
MAILVREGSPNQYRNWLWSIPISMRRQRLSFQMIITSSVQSNPGGDGCHRQARTPRLFTPPPLAITLHAFAATADAPPTETLLLGIHHTALPPPWPFELHLPWPAFLASRVSPFPI